MPHRALLSVVAAASFAALAAPASAQSTPGVVPRAGMVVTHSVRVRPGTYRLGAPTSSDSALITIRGDDVTVDLRRVTLLGTRADADPDTRTGVAIRIDGGHDVRVRGATLRGFRFAIVARGTRRLTLDANDVSDSWKPRLFSGVQHESLVDWLSFHQNEKDEWLRFGAGIYLADVHGGEIRANRGEHGMNGLLVTRSDSLLIWNNVFSYNSGLGIGMYRSSDNRILHNHADFDVRGYSHGFYKRGQDSAALLMFEQCNRNVVAYNSMTHGGDGLFLWAGQHTMDTGEGGANDNLFYGNDFSYAPTNGMEATFSRNTFVANTIVGSDHGLWGGYSFASRVLGNRFARNRIGIAVEHGQENVVAFNTFDGDSTAIRLWANPIEPSDWGYPKHRDTASRDWRIADNTLSGHRVALRAEHTTGIEARGNRVVGVDTPLVLAPDVRVDASAFATTMSPTPLPDSVRRLAPPTLAGGLEPASSAAAHRDRSAIVIDEWGPYDWRTPKLWPVDSGRGPSVKLRVLGPLGTWRLVARRGIASISRTAGRTGDTIVVAVDTIGGTDWSLAIAHRATGARAEARAEYARYEPRIAWSARWYAWADSAHAPTRDAAAHDALLASTPLRTDAPARLDIYGYGAPAAGLPRERVLLVAEGRVTLPAGAHTLRLISEDAARVWVDGHLAIDAWAAHDSRPDYAELSGGAHDLRVEYAQEGGWTELRLEVLRGVVARSAGSPGPH